MPRLRLIILLLSIISMTYAIAATDTTQVTIKIIETTDVHGNFFPYDFINRRQWQGSLSRVATYVKEQRRLLGDENVILVDNGDVLQGQPTAYYYNFIDTASAHVAARMMNYLRYDAATIGNHDIETGHAVYDRWIGQCEFPVLGANVIDTLSQKPYLPAYTVVERHGVKIALFGLTTPGVPAWLPETLWSGLRFDDMEMTAHEWVPRLIRKENPDLVVGLFHSGSDSTQVTGGLVENASKIVAERVAGFDIVMMGHDHRLADTTVTNIERRSVSLLNPSSNARFVAEATVTFSVVNGRVVGRSVKTALVSMADYAADAEFEQMFYTDRQAVDAFVSRRLGYNACEMKAHDAYFGPSAFVDFIHTLQLDLSGADISMAAPLSYDAVIKKGDIFMGDMFNLYKFENMLYVMRLSGREIKDYLEMSYDLWINTITSPSDHMLRISDNVHGRVRFVNPTYNFDSAAGVIYTVDVTKPCGMRVLIHGMANGDTFDFDRNYKVAINSYRGNGGGDLLTEGAGIDADSLRQRLVWSTDVDLRYHLMKMIESKGVIDARPLNHWRFIPDDIVRDAALRDREALFGR